MKPGFNLVARRLDRVFILTKFNECEWFGESDIRRRLGAVPGSCCDGDPVLQDAKGVVFCQQPRSREEISASMHGRYTGHATVPGIKLKSLKRRTC